MKVEGGELKSVASTNDTQPFLTLSRARCIIIVLSLFLFFASLFLPTMGENHSPKLADGWVLFLIGPLGFMIGQFAWVGNIGLILSLMTTRRRPSLITAFSFVAGANWHEIADDWGRKPVTGYGPGYYVWLGSMIVATIPLFFPAESSDAK